MHVSSIFLILICMKKLAKKIHHYYYQFIVGLIFLFIYPFVLLFSRKPFNFHSLNFMRRILSLATSALSGIFFKFRFEEKVDWSKTYIICANHTSNLDISTVILLVKRKFAFLGKDELLDNLVTKIYFETIDIPINRESIMSSYRAFKRSEEYLKSGIHVIIFPEGLIGDQYPPVLNPFKIGPFKLAFEHKVPILPVTIHENWNLMWDDGLKLGSKPGISNVFVHKPVVTESFADAEELRSHVFQIIDQKLNENERSNFVKRSQIKGFVPANAKTV